MARRGLKLCSHLAMLLFASQSCGPVLAAEPTEAITLEQALAEARQANAQLPEAQFKVQQALARARAAHGEFYPKLSFEGDLHGGTPQGYASNDALGRLLAEAPIYAGGELKAAAAHSAAEADSSMAGYRVSVREVDHAVRVAYSRLLRDDAMLGLLDRSIERLQAYFAVVRGRQAAGQGVGTDASRTQQRLAGARADLAAASRSAEEGRMTLNDLLGRAVKASLSLAPLPDPEQPRPATDRPWLASPDIAQSEADVRSGEAGVQGARAGRLPRVSLQVGAGYQSERPGPAPLNNGTGAGGEVLLNFSLPLWDNGVYRAHLDEARAALDEARQHRLVVKRAAELSWMQAVKGIQQVYAEYVARRAAADAARDAYLEAESLYRGGQGTALEVLDAHDAWVQAGQSLLDVIYSYRVAQADVDRWETP